MQRNHTGGWRKKVIRVLILLILNCGTLMLNLFMTTPSLATGVSPTALTVYGQQGLFTSNTANNGGVSATSLSTPGRIAINSSGGIYIADTGNNRVLYFLAGSTTATRVYGQNGSFTTNTANKGGLSATSLSQPAGVALDTAGNLYVADAGNNRVLYFSAGSTTATRVYGQNGSFTTNAKNHGGVNADSLDAPVAVTLDTAGNLYVADTGNNRVLYFLAGSTTATGVYGQGGDFQSSNVNHGSLDANGLNQPAGLSLDRSGDLYVADSGNNRVLYFSAGSTTATRVYGQNGSFTSDIANNGGVSATSLNQPFGVTLDSNGNIYVADLSNNRVLIFQTALKVTTQPPANIAVGSPFSISSSLVDVGSNGVFSDFNGTVSVVIKPGSGTTGAVLSGTTAVTAVNGVATFSNLSINKTGTAYILTTSSPGVNSATTNPFTVTGSLLFIPLTNPSFSFTLNGTAGTVTSQSTFRVSDTTQSGTGWHMTLTSTQFTTAGGKTLSTSATTITQVSTACTQGQTCTLPTNTISGYPLIVPAGTTAPAPITYFRAAAGTGTGDITLTITFSLQIPVGTASGSYTSLFTETLVKGQ